MQCTLSHFFSKFPFKKAFLYKFKHLKNSLQHSDVWQKCQCLQKKETILKGWWDTHGSATLDSFDQCHITWFSGDVITLSKRTTLLFDFSINLKRTAMCSTHHNQTTARLYRSRNNRRGKNSFSHRWHGKGVDSMKRFLYPKMTFINQNWTDK